MTEMAEWNDKKLNSVKELYELMCYWHVKMQVHPDPGFIAWELPDVPRIVGIKNPEREIVAMSGLDCWLRGNLKHPNVSKEEALAWLLSGDTD